MDEDMLQFCATCQEWRWHKTSQCEDTKCHRCGEKGHVKRKCPEVNQMVLNGDTTGTNPENSGNDEVKGDPNVPEDPRLAAKKRTKLWNKK